jgi:hypothetical protein
LMSNTTLRLRILKRRGGWATDLLTIVFDDTLNQTTPDYAEMPIYGPATPDQEVVFLEHESLMALTDERTIHEN